jgi:hypothetical protein
LNNLSRCFGFDYNLHLNFLQNVGYVIVCAIHEQYYLATLHVNDMRVCNNINLFCNYLKAKVLSPFLLVSLSIRFVARGIRSSIS